MVQAMRRWGWALLLVTAGGCKGWAQSYSPEYLSDVTLGEGELDGATKRGVYCGCSEDTSYGETQLYCEPEDVPAFGELFFYAPIPPTRHLKQRDIIDVQVGYPDDPYASSGFGVAFIEHARGDALPDDPRNPEIFTRASFAYYVTDLYVPEQDVYSALDYPVHRIVAESRLQVTFWCEDYQQTLANTLGGSVYAQRAVDAWERRRRLREVREGRRAASGEADAEPGEGL